ncbi:TrkH family potassium uptake protein [Methanoplanus endosymbiosus]|uniref:TrkH family potassium uptake protein n=1 Tax=Methanoplanus endosymbiosus TaxID=33865 RepID=A0A9E7TJA7_9EURY|nr:TrkH family potassium uptake protein [Methanoplanus endosymbiosus]UUX93433.1 TrkH family potassium uptake protein [Methanoplanus endosymbiosus]
MNRLEQFSIIADDLGTVFRFLSVGTIFPLLIALYYQEWDMLVPMALVPVALFILGTVLLHFPENKREAKVSQALFSVAFIWLVCAFIGAIPFSLGIDMPYLDAVFESMSGWTDTGITMLHDVDSTPHTLLFWRSLMQWLGGLGIVAFTVVMLSKTGLNQSRFYRSEGRTEAFMPSVVQQGLQMWKIYLILTGISIVVILLSGVPLWDSVNIAMVAIATGGFSVHTAGIPYYNNALLEMLIIPVMIAGALPFKIYYTMYYRRKSGFLKDEQIKLLLMLILIGCIIITADLIMYRGLSGFDALRKGLFMAVAGATSTGFQTAAVSLWAPVTVLTLIFLMFIGGSSGSTAGGIKLSRAAMAYRGILWWFRRSYVSSKVIVPFRYGGKIIPKAQAETEVSRNMIIILLYIMTIFIAVVLIMHFETPDHDTSMVLFDVVSASCNNGISTGFAGPDLSPFSKVVYIFIMWIGRLEIFPVIMLFMGLFKGFE